MFKQIEANLKVSVLTTKVDNVMSNNVTVMVGILHVADIKEQPDGKWKISSLWPSAFPYGSNIVTTREEGIQQIMERLRT